MPHWCVFSLDSIRIRLRELPDMDVWHVCRRTEKHKYEGRVAMGYVTKASTLSTYALKSLSSAPPILSQKVCRFRRAPRVEVVAPELKTRLRLLHEASQNIRAATNAALVGMVVSGVDPADCEAECLHEYLRVKFEHVGSVFRNNDARPIL